MNRISLCFPYGPGSGNGFDIMDIQHLGMGKEAQIHYSIRVPEEKLDTCLSWLRKKGIYCQTVEKEGADSV